MNKVFAITSVCFLVLPAILSAQEGFTWNDCVSMTRTNNPELKSSMELITQSRANSGIARSGYLPQISAGLKLNATQQLIKTRDNNPNTSATQLLLDSINEKKWNYTKSYTYGISGRQLLFDSMRTVYDIKASESMIDDSRLQYMTTSSQVRLNLRVAFVQLLKSQESIAISKEISKRWKKNLDLVRMRYQAGREHKGSLLNAEANLAQAEYELLQAERDITIARINLLKIIGLPQYRPIQVDGPLSGIISDRKKPDIKDIVQSHPLLLRMKKQRESAAFTEKSKISSFLPVITAVGSVEKNASRYSSGLFTNGKTSGINISGGIEVTMPLTTGGNNYYNLIKAKSQERKLKADETVARQQVILDLEQKWNEWQNGIDRVSVQRKFLRAAEERSRIAEAQYSIGLVLFDNWIIIEDQLAKLKKSYLDARASEMIAEAHWLQAKGETLNYDH